MLKDWATMTAQSSTTPSTGTWSLDAGAAGVTNDQTTDQSGLNPYHTHIQTPRVFHPYNCPDIHFSPFRLR